MSVKLNLYDSPNTYDTETYTIRHHFKKKNIYTAEGQKVSKKMYDKVNNYNEYRNISNNGMFANIGGDKKKKNNTLSERLFGDLANQNSLNDTLFGN